MKPVNKSTIYFPAMILGVIIFLASCGTSGVQRTEKTNTTMQVVESDYTQALAQVDVIGAALYDLIKPEQSDMEEAFKKYSDSIDKMKDLEKQLFEHADKMSAQGKDYFAEWQTEGNTYTNPKIQALSEQRRAELSVVFAKISEASVGVKADIQAYMSDIQEIETYLSKDLTFKGIEAITPIAQKAVKDGNSLKYAINPVLSAVGITRTELDQGGKQ